MTIERDMQSASPGVQVELIEVDATSIGGSVSRFITKAVAPVSWGGETFTPVDFETGGWEATGQGALPRPWIKVDNTRQALLYLVLGCNDLRMARVTRWRTYARYLDGMPDADPDIWISRDVYYVAQKKDQSKRYIEFELRCLMDLAGRQLPGRQFVRDWCARRYRVWNADAGAFVYAHADVACPYSGSACFDASGDICASFQDACGKRLSDCKLRFGSAATLPFWGYPGAAISRSS